VTHRAHPWRSEDVSEKSDPHALGYRNAARSARYGASLRSVFDAHDRTILSMLQLQGRMSHAELAKKLGISASAVRERIRKLEEAKVIRAFRAVLDPAKVGLGICAFVSITPEPRTSADALVERLLEVAEIEELHAVAGEYAYIAKVRVTTSAALDELLNRLNMLDGMQRTHTTIVLRTNTERPMHLPFDAGSAGNDT
jgi:Lrp/AsnC family transcriptional regulator, leucine-responsive regulatory protein